MIWLKRSLVGLLAMLLLALVTAYLTPLDVYVPEVERTLATQLHEPVSIQHLRIAVWPLPHLELQGVRLGAQDGIAAESVDVKLDIPALLMEKTLVLRVVVRDGTAHLAQVRRLVELFANAPVTLQSLTLRELQLSGMNLQAPELVLGPLQANLEFAQAGALQRVWIAMDEQRVTATLVPQTDQHFSVQLRARDWVLPQYPQLLLQEAQLDGVLGQQDLSVQNFVVAMRGMRAVGSGKLVFADGWKIQANISQLDVPLEKLMALLGQAFELTGTINVQGKLDAKANSLNALKDNFQFSGYGYIAHATARMAAGLQHPLVFDEVKAQVLVQPEHLELNGLRAKLYGGQLSGTAAITRRDVMLVADVVVSGITMQSLVEALTNEVLFTGSLDSAAELSLRLDAMQSFPANMQLSGDFHLRNGALTKVDLVQAASNPAKSDAKGVTRFDDLSGLLNVDAAGYHFKKIKIKSGMLNADGKLDITPSLQLNGTLDADVKGTIGLVSMPLVVSGTLHNPSVRVSKSALAGAAVGTAILGPGLGTALGVKVGGILKRLFGKDDDAAQGKQSPPPKPPATK